MWRTRPYQELLDEMSPEKRAQMKAAGREIDAEEPELIMVDLDELRQSFDVSQGEMAKRLNSHQAQVSRLERRADLFVSTLQRYLAALGCELEIRAVHPLGTVRIVNFMDLPLYREKRQSVGDSAGRRNGRRDARTSASLKPTRKGAKKRGAAK